MESGVVRQAAGVNKMPGKQESRCCLCRVPSSEGDDPGFPGGRGPGAAGTGEMPPEMLKHILYRWADINQQERSPIPRAAGGSPAGAPGRGEQRVTCRKVLARLGRCRWSPAWCSVTSGTGSCGREVTPAARLNCLH